MADPSRVRLGQPDLEPLAQASWRDTHGPALRRARVRTFGLRGRRAVGGHLGGRSRSGGRRGGPRALRPAGRVAGRRDRGRIRCASRPSESPASSSTAATHADAECAVSRIRKTRSSPRSAPDGIPTIRRFAMCFSMLFLPHAQSGADGVVRRAAAGKHARLTPRSLCSGHAAASTSSTARLR